MEQRGIAVCAPHQIVGKKGLFMHIHWLQHVPFEGLGLISSWIEEQGHLLSSTRLYADEPLPQSCDFDLLIVMGGPMGAYDENEYGWLVAEKCFLRQCIAKKGCILGVCLGAQLLADALGSEVRQNGEKEIGWFEITREPGLPEQLQKILPKNISVLHWHGDTFTLPPGAVHLYGSAACSNQGFIAGERMIGLQFHLEIGKSEIAELIANCENELVGGKWIQEKNLLLAGADRGDGCKTMLYELLEYLCRQK